MITVNHINELTRTLRELMEDGRNGREAFPPMSDNIRLQALNQAIAILNALELTSIKLGDPKS